MGSGQSQLGGQGARARSASPFSVEGGAVGNPMIRPGAVEARDFELELAARALASPTLIVLPAGLGTANIALLVAAERLRQAGGFVLVLSPTRKLVRKLAEAFTRGLADQAATRVEAVTGSTPKAARVEAFGRAWVVVTTPETVVAEVEAGRLALDRCSLLIVDEAHRAVGAFAYAEAVRALRRDRPRALVLGLTASQGGDRRRIQATADVLGLRRIDTRTRKDADIQPFVQPLAVEVIEVELTDDMRRIQGLFEAELQPRAWALTRLGVLPAVPLRFLGKRALVEAGELLRKRHQRNRAVFFEALRTHAQAMLLVEALEILETQGPAPLATYLEQMAGSPDAPEADRAVAAVPAVRDGRALARDISRTPHPKVAALISELQGLLRARPGARALVIASHRESAAALQEQLARAPPLGPAIRSQMLGDPRGEAACSVLITTGAFDEGAEIPRVDLVVFFEAVPSAMRAIQRRECVGRAAPCRVVVLVARETRDEGALAAVQGREVRLSEAVRLMKKGGAAPWAPRGANATLPLEEVPAAVLEPAGGRAKGGEE
jgi:ERCC4-related helicase